MPKCLSNGFCLHVNSIEILNWPSSKLFAVVDHFIGWAFRTMLKCKNNCRNYHQDNTKPFNSTHFLFYLAPADTSKSYPTQPRWEIGFGGVRGFGSGGGER